MGRLFKGKPHLNDVQILPCYCYLCLVVGVLLQSLLLVSPPPPPPLLALCVAVFLSSRDAFLCGVLRAVKGISG